jgi:hypothetical protein
VYPQGHAELFFAGVVVSLCAVSLLVGGIGIMKRNVCVDRRTHPEESERGWPSVPIEALRHE